MRFDTYGFGRRLGDVASLARGAEQLGFSALWFTEAGHNPFLPCAVATDATDGRIGVGTAGSGRVPPQPDGDGADRVGPRRPVRRELPARARHAGEGARRAAVLVGVLAPGCAPARVRPRAAGDLPRLPGRGEALVLGRLLLVLAAHRLLLRRPDRVPGRPDPDRRREHGLGEARGRSVRRLPRPPVPLPRVPHRSGAARGRSGRTTDGSLDRRRRVHRPRLHRRSATPRRSAHGCATPHASSSRSMRARPRTSPSSRTTGTATRVPSCASAWPRATCAAWPTCSPTTCSSRTS